MSTLSHSHLRAERDHDHTPELSRPSPRWAPVVIRLAVAGDRASLERLAALDSTDRPAGATLIAEQSGVAVAALELHSGAAVADPFLPTADIIALLRLRAAQLAGATPPSRSPAAVSSWST